jgi:isopenicillin N synthase-like dioxygenase
MPKILTVDFKSSSASEDFFKSLKETGFGVVKNHPVSNKLREEVFAEWAKFFYSDEKLDHMFKRDFDRVQDGYFPPEVAEKAKGAEVLDLKEFYQYYPIAPLPKSLSGKTKELRAQMLEMGKTLLNWVEAELPNEVSERLSMPLSKMVDDQEQTQLRILHYPPLTGDAPEGAVRAAAHEDINLMTLLVSATAAGLQALHTSGKWYDVPCDPGAIAVNTGDMLQEATGHYLTATKHRVINPEDEEAKKSRFSIPLFIHPKPDVKLSERHTQQSYLHERLEELGLLS